MAREFIEFSAGQSLLPPDEFVDVVQRIWTRLSKTARQCRDAVVENPNDDEIAEAAMEAAKELVAFATLMDVGDRLTNDIVAGMFAEARKDPDSEWSRRILEIDAELQAMEDAWKRDSN